MKPYLASFLALLFVLIAGSAVFIMLEITGRTEDHGNKSGWITLHRILGYLYISLFAVMLGFMISKAAGLQEELSARTIFHIVMSLILVPLILTKILIVRRHPALSSRLPIIGLTILALSFGLTGITAGYYLLHKKDLTYTTLSAHDNDVLDLELGKAIMNRKCSKCHSLERVYRAFKSEKGWTGTINKMAAMDTPNISTFDIKQILHYLTTQQKNRQALTGTTPLKLIGKSLVTRKCTVCHTLDRVFSARKTLPQWTTTVNRMIATMDDETFLSTNEKAEIISYLSGRKEKD